MVTPMLAYINILYYERSTALVHVCYKISEDEPSESSPNKYNQ